MVAVVVFTTALAPTSRHIAAAAATTTTTTTTTTTFTESQLTPCTPTDEMKCIFLVAGPAETLEREIQEDTTPFTKALKGYPKALLDPHQDRSAPLDRWYSCVINSTHTFSSIYIATNAEKYKYYERWATTNRVPRQCIINDGSTAATGPRGGVDTLDLVLRAQAVDEDVLVIAGDMLFDPDSFDITNLVDYATRRDGNLLCYYKISSMAEQAKRGMVEVDADSRVTAFYEKPKPGVTATTCASVVLYYLKKESLPDVLEFADDARKNETRPSLGRLMEFLSAKAPLYAMKLPAQFGLIGQVSLDEYRACIEREAALAESKVPVSYTCFAYARVGVMGNPSDGFYGKTISLSIKNFHAQATITETADRLELLPHPLNDPTSFGSLDDLHTISRQEGYQGGLRLMQATCKRFYEYCIDKGISLPKKQFQLKYDTNIPRQVGLAGSSAICTAVLHCLLRFYALNDDDMDRPAQANFVLSVETRELGINAGLQDRVIQAYNGMVYMDFSKEIMDKRGYGEYNYVDVHRENVPRFWLAYLADPSDSGKIHSDVRRRFDAGDDDVVSGMKKFAQFTDAARTALEEGNSADLADLMDANFSLRRELYTDACLGDANLKMVSIAQKHNAAVKFPGSGGAVLGLCRDDDSMWELQKEMEASNFVFVKVVPNWPDESE